MRKSGKLLFVVVLVVLSLCMLAACTNPGNYIPPDKVGNSSGDGDTNSSGGGEKGEPVYLTFSFDGFDGGASSVFRHYYVDEFDVSKVKVSVNYAHVDGAIEYYTKGTAFDLTESMIKEECRPLLKVAGDHVIKVTYNAGGSVVTGSFDLHLQERSNVEYVNLVFNVKAGETVNFASVSSGKATVQVRKGTEYTYSEFISLYPIGKANSALAGWSYGGTEFNSSSEPLTITADTEFSAEWTTDKITVSYDLNYPADAQFGAGVTKPANPADQSVAKNVGVIPRPATADFDKVKGYTFIGWYDAAQNGNKWEFNRLVGESDIKLYAHWELRDYTLTLYLTGGAFKNADPSSSENKTNVESFSDYDSVMGNPFKIQINGLKYNSQYGDYVSNVGIRLTAGTDGNIVTRRIVNIAELGAMLHKGNGAYSLDGWYSESNFAEDSKFALSANTKVEGDLSLYAKWNLTAEDKNDYYVNYMFNSYKDGKLVKSGLRIKSDGTIAITYLFDSSITEFEIPDEITIEGKTYKVTEIGDKAFQSSQNLMSVDLTKATSLKKIGDFAFAYSAALKEVLIPSTVTEIGYKAFYGTEWENGTPADGQFLIRNGILISYLGNKDAESVVIPSNKGIKVIGPGAFSGMKNLSSVTVPAGVERIEKLAFEQCSALATIDVQSTTLKYVSGSAFNDTAYINGGGDSVYHALILGNIYYRYVGVNESSATVTIPSSVTIIAPGAFSGKTNIRDIRFADARKIKSIGEAAFSATSWIRRNIGSPGDAYYISDGFVVVNGILTDYVGKPSTGSVIVPNDVTMVAGNAFSNYMVVNVTFTTTANELVIQSGAFREAVNLKSISYDVSDPALLRSDVASDAFANKNGVLPEGLTFYFRNALLTELQNPQAPVCQTWKSLYSTDAMIFQSYKVQSAEFNTSINLPVKYLGVQNFDIKQYWRDNNFVNSSDELIKAARIIMSNGEISYANVHLSEITASNEVGARELSFTRENIAVKYSYTVFKAIDAPIYNDLDSANTTIDGRTGKIKAEFLPEICYTTQREMDLSEAILKISYIDGTESTSDITQNMLSDFRYSEGRHTVYITYDYQGLATYRIAWEYQVKKPGIEKIVQSKPLSLPFYSDSSKYISDGEVQIVREDGSYTKLNLGSANVEIKSVNDTSVTKLFTNLLGHHKATFEYTDSDKNKTLFDFAYSVVLMADYKAFHYTYHKTGTGEDEVRTAVVTSLATNDHGEVMVIPWEVVNPEDGKTYTVTELGGSGVFKDDNLLKAVILPDSIKIIGDDTFNGCVNLAAVASYHQESKTAMNKYKVTIPIDYLEIMGVRKEIGATLTATGMKGAENLDEIIMGASFKGTKSHVENGIYQTNITGTVQDVPYTYTVTENYSITIKMADDLFDNYNGKIYLLDTPENHTYAETNLAAKLAAGNVMFYKEGEKTATKGMLFSFADANGEYGTLTKDETYTEYDTAIKYNARIDVTPNIHGDGIWFMPVILAEENDTVNNERSVYLFKGIRTGAFKDIINSPIQNKRLIYPDSLVMVESGTLADPDQMVPIVYPASGENIMFQQNGLPKGVQKIGKSAFANTPALKTFEMSDPFNLTEIDTYAFQKSGITSIDLSKTKLTRIKDYAFTGCKSLLSVKLNADIKVLGNGAFYECSLLNSVTGYGVVNGKAAFEFIGEYCFYACQAFVPMPIVPECFVPESAFQGTDTIV